MNRQDAKTPGKTPEAHNVTRHIAGYSWLGRNMSSHPLPELDDIWENMYLLYVNALRALASPPEVACSLHGHFNVAYELWYEVRGGVSLAENPKHRLSPAHIALMSELAAALEQLPPEAIAFTDIAQESVRRLKHPSWARPRSMAARLLLQLGQVTSSNLAYINSPKAV